MEQTSAATAIISAIGISLANFAASLLVSRWAFRKTLSAFVGVVLGSMIIRLGAVAIIAWVCLQFLHLHQLAFSLALVIATFILIMIEVWHFHKSVDAYREFLRNHDEMRQRRVTTI